MKKISGSVWDEAVQLVTVSQAIDYQQIIANNRAEVAKLRKVVEAIRRKRLPADEALIMDPGPLAKAQDVGVMKSQGVPSREDPDVQRARRQDITRALVREGFDARLAKVYCSDTVSRSLAFKSVPHRYGLREFDMVIAPDFCPQAGMHGIFIGRKEVYSAILVNPAERNDWRVLKQGPYQTLDEMVELVTLLAAGFDLP